MHKNQTIQASDDYEKLFEKLVHQSERIDRHLDAMLRAGGATRDQLYRLADKAANVDKKLIRAAAEKSEYMLPHAKPLSLEDIKRPSIHELRPDRSRIFIKG